MYRKTKNRVGCHQATSNTSKFKRHSTGLTSHLMESIITLVVWGWLPMCLGNWVIQRRKKYDA
jgi:hypothetical protein